MNERTKEFIRNKFREYYQSTSLQLPPRFEQREWGFIFFDESFPDIVMRRHKSFMTAWEAIDYIRTMVPAHAFHSAAYYVSPSAPTMQEKGWQGADLIFDIDADHLPIKWTTYKEMLQRTKEELLKLLGFLREDFAIAEDDIEIVFSGGRGYHIHVRDSRLIGLGSPERREIVDYVKGPDLGQFFEKKTGSEEGANGRRKAYKRFEVKYGEGGWDGRINKSIVDFVDTIRQMPKDKALEVLMSYECFKKRRNAEDFFDMFQDERRIQLIKERGTIDIRRGSAKFWRSLIEESIKRESISMDMPSINIGKGTPDEPVTADVKRLIRLPTSIHGGYGFRVTPLMLEGLEGFNPLNDAIVFGDDLIRVNVTKTSDVEIKDNRYVLKIGKQSLPEHLAIFLMCRGAAEYEP